MEDDELDQELMDMFIAAYGEGDAAPAAPETSDRASFQSALDDMEK